jgi:ribonuclease P protein component
VATYTFTKATRLLTPFDYKQVFAAAALRVSTKELLILARSNQLDHARLGIVVAKKNVRRATQRNRIKRIVRETFRHQQHQLVDSSGGIDAIVLARSGLGLLDNAALHKLLNQLWRQLQRKANKQATE